MNPSTLSLQKLPLPIQYLARIFQQLEILLCCVYPAYQGCRRCAVVSFPLVEVQFSKGALLILRRQNLPSTQKNVPLRVSPDHQTNNFIIAPTLISRGNLLRPIRSEFRHKIKQLHLLLPIVSAPLIGYLIGDGRVSHTRYLFQDTLASSVAAIFMMSRCHVWEFFFSANERKMNTNRRNQLLIIDSS